MTHWLPQRQSAADSLPLLCLPFAGGGTAVYHQWQIDRRIEVLPVRLPGRESRFNEPAYEDLEELVERLLVDLEALWTSRFALFGHSMGAVIACELARRTSATGQGPVCLFVSACRAPNRIDRDSLGPLCELPTEEMVDGLIRRFGMQVNEDERALMLMLEATIRSDLRLFDSYQSKSKVKLTCPVFACGGADDPHVNRTDLDAWRALTSASFSTRMFAGGHFFVRTHHQPLSRYVEKQLLGLL